MKKLANMPNKQLTAILKQHGIDKGHWSEVKALVYFGKRPGSDLHYRLNHVGNYVECLHAILTELSKGITHRFPPAGWQPSSHRNAS
jgi:hypothetical protein